MRTTYRLTPAGREELRSLLRSFWTPPVRVARPVDMALNFVTELPTEEIEPLLHERLQALANQIALFRPELRPQFDDPARQARVDDLHDHELSLLEAEREWCEHVLEATAIRRAYARRTQDQKEGEDVVTETASTRASHSQRPRKRWKRRLVIVAAVLLALVVVGAGALWILKPWVPDIVLTEPGPTGERIVERGIFGNYYPAKGRGRHDLRSCWSVAPKAGSAPASRSQALDLQDAGFNVLALSYFGAPGQPKQPRARPARDVRPRTCVAREASGGRSGSHGGSRSVEGIRSRAADRCPASGAEGGGRERADERGVAGDRLDRLQGELVLDVGRTSAADRPVRRRGAVRRSRTHVSRSAENFADHPDAMIPVERIHGSVLLVCGEKDDLWPACTMARQLKARSAKEHGPSVRILAYRGAGHGVFGPPVARDDERYARLGRWGGTPEGTNRVRAEAWPKVIAFLRTTLR